jgi:2-polyprenyl-3-methyl-5-hydroxy-6-metoxy-1,4-benzoquinol methylase
MRPERGAGSKAIPRRDRREKTAAEFQIEERWCKLLRQGASTEDFQRAYDELHAEFLRRQGEQGEIYADINPRSETEDRVRAVVLRSVGTGARVLEVGTGDGRTAYLLARQGNRVLSIDVSHLAIEGARSRWGREPGLDLRFEYGDARSLSLPDASFDFVVSENLVEHLSLEDMCMHLREMRRLLGPGGGYLLYTPSRLWSGRVSAGFHLHVYTLRELCAVMAEAGFGVSWLEPRLLHRMRRLGRISGTGLRLAWLYESLLVALRVHTWPGGLKARVIPGVMVYGQVRRGDNGHEDARRS